MGAEGPQATPLRSSLIPDSKSIPSSLQKLEWKIHHGEPESIHASTHFVGGECLWMSLTLIIQAQSKFSFGKAGWGSLSGQALVFSLNCHHQSGPILWDLYDNRVANPFLFRRRDNFFITQAVCYNPRLVLRKGHPPVSGRVL